MFNNTNPETNGERAFYECIKDRLEVVFDVGCRYDSCFTEFPGDVHYFEPVPEYIEQLKQTTAMVNNNRRSYFNAFGLGNENKTLDYYPKWQSFYDRSKTLCEYSFANATKTLLIRKATDYIDEHTIPRVDLLKIDTEGYEFEVIKGFGDYLKNVQWIQFEYGGTYLDSCVKLMEVVAYLRNAGFDDFSYLTPNGTAPIQDFTDHYQYCNIVCVNRLLGDRRREA
jgi:FkbM family methyltransferase